MAPAGTRVTGAEGAEPGHNSSPVEGSGAKVRSGGTPVHNPSTQTLNPITNRQSQTDNHNGQQTILSTQQGTPPHRLRTQLQSRQSRWTADHPLHAAGHTSTQTSNPIAKQTIGRDSRPSSPRSRAYLHTDIEPNCKSDNRKGQQTILSTQQGTPPHRRRTQFMSQGGPSQGPCLGTRLTGSTFRSTQHDHLELRGRMTELFF